MFYEQKKLVFRYRIAFGMFSVSAIVRTLRKRVETLHLPSGRSHSSENPPTSINPITICSQYYNVGVHSLSNFQQILITSCHFYLPLSRFYPLSLSPSCSSALSPSLCLKKEMHLIMQKAKM